MSKTIYLTESQLGALKLKPFIYKAIMGKHTSLGDNPALPPSGDFGFIYDIAKHRFEEVSERLDGLIGNGLLENNEPDYLVSELSKRIKRCIDIEEPLKPHLEKLCEKIINEQFSIPEEVILLKCELVRNVKSKHAMRIMPEDVSNNGDGYSFEDVDEMELSNKLVLKRRTINALIQGASIIYSVKSMLRDYANEIDKLSSELIPLWKEILIISDYLLFIKEEKITDKNPMQNSYVEVHIGKRGKKTSIFSQGIIFPFLLKETFKGFFELFSSHGLPEDDDKAMYIIRKADFLVAEPWDIRLGVPMWEIIYKQLKGTELMKLNTMPYFFTDLCDLELDEFNKVVKNLLASTKVGVDFVKDEEMNIVHDIEYQKFKDRIQAKNDDSGLLTDDCFTSDELDKVVIGENATNEMMGYHGSGADFDKFNHKKYLNTGAGSQTFGWGTYITDDEKVANGYAKNAKQINGNNEEEIEKVLIQKYGYDEESAKREANDFASNFKWAGSLDDLNELLKNSINADWESPESKERFRRWLEILANLPTNDTYLYEVEIPDDNGQNYIEWYGYFPPHFMKRVLQGFLRIHDKYLDMLASRNYPFKCDLYKDIQWMKANPEQADKMMNIICSNDDYEDFFSTSYYTNKGTNEGRNVYMRLESIMGSPKAASLFLMQCGFDGIKYPSGTKWKKPDGASEDAYNYVIFNANKVKIIKKEKY